MLPRKTGKKKKIIMRRWKKKLKTSKDQTLKIEGHRLNKNRRPTFQDKKQTMRMWRPKVKNGRRGIEQSEAWNQRPRPREHATLE